MRYKPIQVWSYASEKTRTPIFFDSFFAMHIVAKRYILQQVSEWTNRNMPATNTLVQLLALYTDPDSHKCTALQTE